MTTIGVLFTILTTAFTIISGLLVYIWKDSLSDAKKDKEDFRVMLATLELKLSDITKAQEKASIKSNDIISELRSLSKETAKIENNMDKYSTFVTEINVRLTMMEEWRRNLADKIELIERDLNKQ
jgi:predicted nuclease with TOPRIM domain